MKALRREREWSASAAVAGVGAFPSIVGQFMVLCRKHSGAFVEFSRYAVRADAEQVAKLLRWTGSDARVDGPAE